MKPYSYAQMDEEQSCCRVENAHCCTMEFVLGGITFIDYCP